VQPTDRHLIDTGGHCRVLQHAREPAARLPVVGRSRRRLISVRRSYCGVVESVTTVMLAVLS
jgi:hypothetical protein